MDTFSQVLPIAATSAVVLMMEAGIPVNVVKLDNGHYRITNNSADLSAVKAIMEASIDITVKKAIQIIRNDVPPHMVGQV